MTARPPEDPERYSDYGDASGSTAQYAYGQYGEQVQRIQPGQQYGSAPDPYAAPIGQFTDPSAQYGDPSAQYGDPSAQYGDPSGQYGDPPAQYGDPSAQPGQYDATAVYGDQLAAAPPPQAADMRGKPGGKSARPPRNRPASGPGFLGSLFDFDFTSFVTPKIIKSVYLVAVLALAVTALAFIVNGFGVHVPFGAVTRVLLGVVYFFLGLALIRVMLEFFMVVFRMAEDLHDIRERGGGPR
jgi:hypothetical protein